MNLATNICAIRNYGTERYKCIDTAGFVAYIDVLKREADYRAYVQIGKPNVCLVQTWFESKFKTRAVLQAFERIQDHVEGSEEEDMLCCPNILRKHFDSETTFVNQLELF